MRERLQWDIFCRVVDHFGDAAVSWRLARQLALEERQAVRLFIDDLAVLRKLHPGIASTERQTVDGVQVWWGEAGAGASPAANVVVEAFGCGVPDAYVAGMGAATRPPLWIVLEYLSAEPWVSRHHGLPSPHPRLGLPRFYFFPGFSQETGGLLREADLDAQRREFGPAQQAAFWHELGQMPPAVGATVISLFAYADAPLAKLLRVWTDSDHAIVAVVPEGKLWPALQRHFRRTALTAGDVLQAGALEVRAVSFLPQWRYDHLLWLCDVNFTRGEDSFVRGQWACRPFVWQLYPQQDQAHGPKLAAFLARYAAELPAPATRTVEGMFRYWNQIQAPGVSAASAWDAYRNALPVLREHAPRWADHLAGLGGLTANLVRFCRDKLK